MALSWIKTKSLKKERRWRWKHTNVGGSLSDNLQVHCALGNGSLSLNVGDGNIAKVTVLELFGLEDIGYD